MIHSADNKGQSKLQPYVGIYPVFTLDVLLPEVGEAKITISLMGPI